MQTKSILIIHGHPDPDRERFNYALAKAYSEAAVTAGHKVNHIYVADTQFPILRTEVEYYKQSAPEGFNIFQKQLEKADHVVIFFPLWMGGMPALLKGFLEQLLRPGFAYSTNQGKFPEKLLIGRSARVVVTAGMPALVYRWFYLAHGLRNLNRNILYAVGFKPVASTVFGGVGEMKENTMRKYLEKMENLGSEGA